MESPDRLKGKSLSFTDKPRMAISPDGQDVYVAFNSSDSYVVASHDGGATFASRVVTNSDSLYWFAEGGAVAPGGDVYFAESAENQSSTGTVAPGTTKTLYVRTSTDGESWSARTDVGQNTGDNGFPSVEAGAAAGDFRLMWQDSRNGSEAWNTWYAKTADGGATWSRRSSCPTNRWGAVQDGGRLRVPLR